MFAFEELDAWHRCHELTLAVYRITRRWPKDERFGLTAQIRRCSVSTEANLAEGSAKRGPAQFRRFLDISLGSHAELACLIRIANDLGYLTEEELSALEEIRSNASKVTWRLYQYASQKAKARK